MEKSTRRAPSSTQTRSRCSIVALLGVASLALVAVDARAQSNDSEKAAAAQTLYEQATAEMDKKDYAKACPKLEEVVRLVPGGIGAKLTLGECYEGEDKLASAYAAYELAASAAEKSNDNRARRAHDKAAALKPKLAWLTINVPDAVRTMSGLEIKRDTITVGPGMWGVPLPVDKGSHTIVATANGKRTEHTVDIATNGATVSYPIEFTIAPAPPPATSATNDEPTPPPPASDTTTTPGEGLGTQRILAVAAGGVGVVGVVVGSIFGIKAIGKKSDSNQGKATGFCDPGTNDCGPAGVTARNDGLAAGNVSTVFFVVGAVGIAGGVVLWATAPKRGQAATSQAWLAPKPSIEVHAGLGKVGVRGSF